MVARKSRVTIGDGNVNIQVAVRVRPLGGSTRADGLLAIRDNQLSMVNPTNNQKEAFNFDYLYGPETKQLQLFDDIGSQILDYAFEGYNGTIFA